MRTLHVLYDSRCGLCSRLRHWLVAQPAHLDSDFIAAGSERAQRLFPGIDLGDDPEELIVVSDEGDVWDGDAAWLVCLWCLVEYRPWSYRLSSPALLPYARRAYELLSRNRRALSGAFVLGRGAGVGGGGA